MGFLRELLINQVLVSAVTGWLVAQVLKTGIEICLSGSFNPERLTGSGGMPSSHSSTVCALTVSSGLQFGVSSFEFAISFVLACVVMYDATGVRRETGRQAKLLNLILEQDLLKLSSPEYQEKLKELVGHTPLQVFVGAVLGVVIALMVNLLY